MAVLNSSLPLYKQILLDIKHRLKVGQWKTGDLFPSEKELMDQYNVSSITVRRVIYELVNEGWIERRAGIGTFVKKEYVEPLERLTSFFEEILAKGSVPSSKILVLEEIQVTPKLCEEYSRLELFDKNTLYLMEKVNLMDGVPVEYHRSFWPREIGQALSTFDLKQRGLYDILQNELGVVLVQAQQEIKAVLPNGKIAEELGILLTIPVLSVERLTYGNDGRVIELATTTYHPEKYRCRIVSHNNYLEFSL